MGKKLYVGNLPFEVTEDQLRELFTPHGQIETATVIIDKFSGRSKGFGFVEFATDEEAQGAIEKLNNTTVGTRQIVVNEARPMEERRPGGGGFRVRGRGGPGGGGGRGGERSGGGGGRPGKGKGGFNRW